MSRLNVVAFADKMHEYLHLREELMMAAGPEGIPAQKLIEIARREGYPFSVDDLRAELANAPQHLRDLLPVMPHELPRAA
jgi:hypothetical protein